MNSVKTPLGPAEGAAAFRTHSALVVLSGATVQAFTAVMYVLVARSTTPAAFGQTVVGLSLVATLAIVIDFGLNLKATKDLSTHAASVSEVLARQSGKLVLAMPLFTFMAVAWIAWSSNWRTGASLAVFGMISVAEQALLTVPRANGNFRLITSAPLAGRALGTVALLAQMRLGVDPPTALVEGLLLGSLVSASILLVGEPSLRAAWRSLADVRFNGWVGARPYGVAGMLVAVQQLDVAVLSGVAGPLQAGLLAAVQKWVTPFYLAASGVGFTGATYVARGVALASARRHALLLQLPLAMAAIAVAPMSSLVVTAILGSEYEGASPVLVLLLLAASVVVFNQPLWAMLQMAGRERAVMKIGVAGALTYVGGICLVGSSQGAVGAAAVFLAVQVGLLVALLVIASRQPAQPASGPNADGGR